MVERLGALDGVKVVACSQAQAGTVQYMLMAMMGAEVIKIEPPGVGDSSRAQAGQIPGFPSSYFETNNRGVKSFTLNLKKPGAKEILYELVKDADIFGQNFRPGAMERAGAGYEDLKKVNPRIIYVSVSAYGPKGPHAQLPGTDSIGQALGGITEAFSTPGQPLKTGIVSVADETCAILAYGAILTGLYCAKMTGIGQKIDCSLLGGQIRLMGHVFNTAMWKQENPITGQARIGGTAQQPSLASSFNDKNGKPFVIQLIASNANQWKTAMTALGFYETLEEKGVANLGDAVVSEEKRQLLLQTLNELFATDTRDKWVEILRKVDIVSAPINTLLEASNDPDVIANEYVTRVDYPKYDKKIKVHGSPWTFSETPAKIGIAPELGEHTVPILKRHGYSDAQIKELKDREVI
jgi:crotonobetainyl-CoA:carnitine CoA-transferase CaiB-like acyl-CoA transferase